MGVGDPQITQESLKLLLVEAQVERASKLVKTHIKGLEEVGIADAPHGRPQDLVLEEVLSELLRVHLGQLIGLRLSCLRVRLTLLGLGLYLLQCYVLVEGFPIDTVLLFGLLEL